MIRHDCRITAQWAYELDFLQCTGIAGNNGDPEEGGKQYRYRTVPVLHTAGSPPHI